MSICAIFGSKDSIGVQVTTRGPERTSTGENSCCARRRSTLQNTPSNAGLVGWVSLALRGSVPAGRFQQRWLW